MFNCKKCGIFFRDVYNLNRHQSRIRPCVKEIINNKIEGMSKNVILDENNTSENPNNTSENPNNTSENPNNTSENPNNTSAVQNNTLSKSSTENNTCKYCLHNFTTISNKNKHLLICKYLDDPIRNLEIENDIIPELPGSKTECRFCNKIFCRIDVLNKHITNCKEREVYKQILIKEKEQKVTNNITINNNCNNVTNNNLILNFGQTNDTTKIEEIVEALRIIKKEYKNDQDQIYLMAGDFITRYEKMLMRTPENDNLRIHDSKSMYAEVRITGGWEKEPLGVLNDSFKDRASKLYNKKEEINNHNERVLKNKTVDGMFTEFGNFSNRGFRHSYNATDNRIVRTNFKVSKLKNKVECDF
jgi:hypothetical protein